MTTTVYVTPSPTHTHTQLHTGKAIGEVVKDICGTFSISDPSDYYLWIPTGIQSIIEKYGGKPVSLSKMQVIGTFNLKPGCMVSYSCTAL